MVSVSKKRRREEQKTTDEEMMTKKIKLEDNISIAANDHHENTESSRKRSRSSDDSATVEEERSSQKLQSSEAERLPEHIITNYAFHWSLGRGSFGKVFLASLPTKKEQVAVKVIRKTRREDLKGMIKKEARILKVTSGSPFLCHGYAAFQTKVCYFQCCHTVCFTSYLSLKLSNAVPKSFHLYPVSASTILVQFLRSRDSSVFGCCTWESEQQFSVIREAFETAALSQNRDFS
ncbi:protein kinase C epsilon type-like [Xenopus laevis]|uniref:Protein kinase C epsilon type-like n=1 Tax=Xenopus laevis TaxID=8355 RepID=A0A8J1MEQ4_XENLA|nr:protein kinase C epsilon type-like [Xenopus laevis]